MLLENRYPLKKITHHIWKEVIGATIYASIIAFAHEYFHQEYLEIPPSVPSILGTALALFLSFRMNSAYDRWWEARKAWGSIVNETRSFIRQLHTFIQSDLTNPESSAKSFITKISYRTIAWCYALTRSLRKQDPFIDLPKYLDNEDIEFLKNHDNVPNGILHLQGESLKSGLNQRLLNDFGLVRLDATLSSLCDSMGKCERIKNTVFPTQYRLFIHLFIFIFVFILPYGLVDSMGYVSIGVTAIIAFLFLMIESIENMLQNPFECLPNDTPMLSLSRTIEINIMQQLGEFNVPEKIQPKDGVLY